MSILTVNVFYLRFQWVNLQLKHLAGMKFQQDIVENLGKLPRSLQGTYSQTLTTMRDSANGREWEVTKRALMWVMCSEELLTEGVWTEMSYWPIPVPRDGADILFELCQNLVTLDSGSSVVRFAHLSVQEYLESDREFTSVAANSMAFLYCLSRFDPSEFCPLDLHHLSGATQHRLPPLTAVLDYASRCWTGHMERIYDCDPSLDRDLLDNLKRFLLPASPAYRNWLESTKFLTDQTKEQQTILPRLLSAPINPLFLAARFRFGGLRELWEGDDLSLNATNGNEETLLFVATACGNDPVMEILFEKGADIYWENTVMDRPLITAILGLKGGLELAANLIHRCTSVIGFAKALEISATYGDENLVKVVLDRYPDLMITEGISMAATRNWRSGNMVGQMLVSGRYNTRITNCFVVDLARRSTPQLMWMLLHSCPNLEITETVMIAAAENYNGKEMMSMLLARDMNVPITEAVVTAAARNLGQGREILSMLLARDMNILWQP